MYPKRIFQIIAAVYSLLFALFLLTVACVASLQFLNVQLPEIAQNLIEIVNNAASRMPTASNVKTGRAVVIFLAFALPALLIFVGVAMLFAKPRVKRFRHTVASIIIVVGATVSTLSFLLMTSITYNIPSLSLSLTFLCNFLILFALNIVAVLLKRPESQTLLLLHEQAKLQVKEDASEELAENALPAQDEEQTQTTTPTATDETTQRHTVKEDEPNTRQTTEVMQETAPEQPTRQDTAKNALPEQDEEQTQTTTPTATDETTQQQAAATCFAEDQPYLTQHFTVSDITDSTYGNVETITPQTLKKIQKLRLLLQTHAITEEEYVALVDSYLHGDKQQK
ncbi:unknown [Corallococcus sp. CAG:1435]|nr:unknown [Corallococcus sp. CAG:1435]